MFSKGDAVDDIQWMQTVDDIQMQTAGDSRIQSVIQITKLRLDELIFELFELVGRQLMCFKFEICTFASENLHFFTPTTMLSPL